MAKRATTTAETAATDPEVIETDDATIAKLCAEARSQGVEEGRLIGLADGAKSERERILAIDKLTLRGHEKLAAQCKADGTTSGDFVMKQVEAQKATQEAQLAAIKKDGQVAVDPAPSATGEVKTTTDDSKLPLEERCKAQWEKDPDLRAEFGEEFAAYVAYEKNAARGLVKIRKAS